MSSSSRASFWLLPVIYLGFISLGLPDGSFGVAWPRMHLALGLPVGLAGTLVMVGILFAAMSSFSSGRIIARLGTGPVVLVSGALTGTGLMLFAHAQNIWWLWLAAVPLGFGAGAVDTGLNAFVARHYSGRHMNWLHACWGIGAMCGPLIMSRALAGDGGWRGGFFAIASVQLTLALVFLATLRWWRAVPLRPTASPATVVGARRPTAQANAEAGWLSAGIFILYVAVEGTMGIWAGSILVLARGVPEAIAGGCVAAYYGAIAVGRVLAGFVVHRWSNRRVVTAGWLLAASGAALFVFATSPALAAVALVLTGLGCAPIYPCLMHEVPQRFVPEAVMTVITRQSGAAYLGGAFFPAAAGWLAQNVSLDSVAWSIAAGVLVLAAAIRRLDRIT